MSGPAFTQAQIRRAIEGARSAGLRVTGVTVKPDGSLVVHSGDNQGKDGQEKALERSKWADPVP